MPTLGIFNQIASFSTFSSGELSMRMPKGTKRLLFPLSVVLSVAFARPAQAEPEKHHIFYDHTDKVWLCLGSAVDCFTAAE